MSPALIHSDNEFEQALADGATVALGPDIWMEILEDIYRAEDGRVKARMADIRQARIKHASDLMTHLYCDELGTPSHKTDVEAYHAWAWRFRDQHDHADYSCWNDDEFVREWKRDNESVRVRVDKPGNRVGWTPQVEKSARKFLLTDERGNAA